MSLKRLFKEYTPEEIVDAMILPVKLNQKQREEAERQLAEHRIKRREGMTEQEKLRIKLSQL